MIDIAILRAMASAGAPVEAILAAIEADQRAEIARVQARRIKDAQRQSVRREAGATISAELRIAVYERDDWKCVYCSSEDRLTCDHVIPVKKQGETTLENLVTACLSCNSRKQDRDRKQFERELDRDRKSKEIPGHPETSERGDLSLTSSLSSNKNNNIASKKERDTARKTALPETWQPNEAHYAKCLGARPFVNQKADDMRNWAKSKGIRRVDWDATFHGFLRPQESKSGMNGHAQTDRDRGKSEFKQALGELREFASGTAGGSGSEPTLRLLPAAGRRE